MISQAKPGEIYSVFTNMDGSFTLSPVNPANSVSPKSRLAKEHGYTVFVPNQPIDEKAIERLLANFP